MVEENPIQLVIMKIKYLEINLTRNVQNLCEENFKTVLKDTKQT